MRGNGDKIHLEVSGIWDPLVHVMAKVLGGSPEGERLLPGPGGTRGRGPGVVGSHSRFLAKDDVWS